MWKMLVIRSICPLFLCAPVLAQSPPAVATSARDHAFIRTAEKVFQQELDAERRGDVEAYKRLRSKAAYEGTVANLARMGKSPGDLGPLLKAVAKPVDLSKFAFIRADAKQTVARLLYRKDGKDAEGHATADFLVFMMHWEDGAWRIGMVGDSGGRLSFMGKDRTIDELAGKPWFALK